MYVGMSPIYVTVGFLSLSLDLAINAPERSGHLGFAVPRGCFRCCLFAFCAFVSLLCVFHVLSAQPVVDLC